jgi:hypothetical protein
MVQSAHRAVALAMADDAEGLAAQAAALLQLSPRPSRNATRSARRLYLQALRSLDPQIAASPTPERLPLRRLSQRVDQLLWRARLAAWLSLARRYCTSRRIAALLAALAIASSVPFVSALLHPDLLAGRPFQTSSEWAKCDAARASCGGATTRIFFHTNEELKPSITYDLGRIARLKRLEVTNRRDAASERAVPLVIQTSIDGQHWKEVARRDYWFDVWRADFTATDARYLKLLVDRRSILHLERVQAWQ